MHVVGSLIKGAACNQIVHVGTIQIKRRSGKKRDRDGCNKTRWILTGMKRTRVGLSLAVWPGATVYRRGRFLLAHGRDVLCGGGRRVSGLLFRHAHIMCMGQIRFWVGGDSNNPARRRSELPPQMQVGPLDQANWILQPAGRSRHPGTIGCRVCQFPVFHRREKTPQLPLPIRDAFWLWTGGLGRAMCAPVTGVHLQKTHCF